MNADHSGTYEYLLQQYGPLLTLKHVAELMHSTPNGVRMAISRQNQAFAVGLSSAKRRLGRRVYFEARRVAEVIDQDIPGHDPSVIPLGIVGKQRSM
ncbi:MAG: plasmid-related protein [Methylococcaceae bacterium]|nr:plasmid-related protein [Methylococcaceae bacterium]